MRILCFGDSNTYGYDPRGFLRDRYDAEDRWPDLLARQTCWDVINLGANGREIPHGHASLHLLAEYAPVDIFLVTPKAAARMVAFLNALLPHCKNILLVAPPPMKRSAWVETDALVAESVQLAEEYKLPADKLSISFVDTRDWNIALCFDGVHFTESGHNVFASTLIKNVT